MNTSSEFIAELAAADEFVSHVRRLTSKQLRALARRVEDVRPTTAGDIDWWRATAAVSRRLRHVRGSDAAAIAALRASEAVLEAPGLPSFPATLCAKLAHRSWPRVLNAFARRVNPLLAKITAAGFGGYYWVLDQAEIATDVSSPPDRRCWRSGRTWSAMPA